jgi:hypothetical protein
MPAIAESLRNCQRSRGRRGARPASGLAIPKSASSFFTSASLNSSTWPRFRPGGRANRAVTHAHQPADDDADRFEHAAHLAVPALVKRHAVPAVGALAARLLKAGKLRRTVVEIDAIEQSPARTPQAVRREFSPHTRAPVGSADASVDWRDRPRCVSSSSPLVLKSRRPTATQRPADMRGSAVKTFGR